ncbi:hypothetical protein GLP59_17020 [Sulfitobacter sp. M220]|uniref:IS66 family insertion sequence element accessory protein TnpB n=1 Tax=Sulfitobacter sp. M220 TaxID=2675333 RepID=UPI001F9FC80F|nr:hypothetical protein [Sulfitobacter sp. M220]
MWCCHRAIGCKNISGAHCRDCSRLECALMMFPSNRVRIVVATKPVDFRKGHDGLAALVKNELRKDPFTVTVFVWFCCINRW